MITHPETRAFARPGNLNRVLKRVIPPKLRRQLVEEHAYDWRARKITFNQHFAALVVHRISLDRSLRDMGTGVRERALYAAHGAHMAVSNAALSKAHATRPEDIYLDILDRVMATIAQLPHRHRVLREVDLDTIEHIRDLLTRVSIFDATTFELPSQVATWAQVNDTTARCKLQVRLQGGYGGLDKAFLVPGEDHDSLYFTDFVELAESSRIYLFDTGYFSIEHYDELTVSDNFFVTRKHANLNIEIVEKRPVPQEVGSSGYALLQDCTVLIGTDERRSSHRYRALEVITSEGEQRWLLTNLFDLDAEQIAQLWRYRWTIEIVFRWLKSQLKLEHLISYSINGMLIQVTVALIVYGLLVLYNQDVTFSPTRLLRQIQQEFEEGIWLHGYLSGFSDAARLLFSTFWPSS
jgi:IS4 transposase